MGVEKPKNGYKEWVRQIAYDISVVKELLMSLEKKIVETAVKQQYNEQRLEKMEEELRRRNIQYISILISGILAFISGLILFILGRLR